MNSSDYEFYLRIAGKKREKKETGIKQRETIGKFGVGFLSIFPFFKTYQIESTKSGSDEIMFATIPCHLYFSDNNSQIHVGDIKITGGNRIDKSQRQNHYTKITLSGFTRISEEFFFPNTELKYKLKSIKNPKYKNSIEKLKWALSEDLPVQYENEEFNEMFFEYSKNLPFTVFVNEEKLLRVVYANEILDSHKGHYEQIGKIKFQYIICTDRVPVYPIEARGIKIRNINVGVGEREKLENETVGGHSRLQQLTGELHIIDGLNDLIKVSRDGFSYSPDYERLKDLFARKLRLLSKQLEDQAEDVKSLDKSKIKFIKKLNPINEISKSNSGLSNQEKINYPINDDISAHDVKLDSIKNITVTPISGVGINKVAKKNDKIFEISGKEFIVKSDSWDYESEFFQACKIDGNLLIINTKYPLFHGRKHTDVFIKLHVYLILKLQDGLVSRNVYEQMTNDIIKIYKGY